MNEIVFNGTNNEYLKFSVGDDFFKYGALALEIRVGNYSVQGVLHITYGDVKRFGERLNEFYSEMKGTAFFTDLEEELELNLSYNKRGYVILSGRYKERSSRSNELRFEFECTQPNLFSVIRSIGDIKLCDTVEG